MATSLNELREQITSFQPGASHYFSSALLKDAGPGSTPTKAPGDRLSLLLGVVPHQPEQVKASLFDETAGTLIGELPISLSSGGEGGIIGELLLPNELAAEHVCVVIEARWAAGAVAGCELSLSISH